MNRPASRVVAVTGASSGIGRATAIEMARRGHSVALGARRTDALAEAVAEIEAEGGKAFAHALDVSDEASIDAFFTALEEALGPASAVVNNAGNGFPGDVGEIALDRVRSMIATNVVGTIAVTQRALPAMRSAGSGDIVFVSSDSVVRPRPSLVVYSATKAAVEHLATGMAMELEGTGIRVCDVRVGPTLTNFAEQFDLSGDEFMALVGRWRHFGEQRHFETCLPEDMATAIANAIEARPGTRIPVIEVEPVASTPTT